MVVALGDYSYQQSPQCWLELVAPVKELVNIAIGNHEKDSVDQYLKHFNLTNQFYSFDLENVHFLIMSTEIPYYQGSNQFAFVERDLSLASSNHKIDWIIISYHRQAYTSLISVGDQPVDRTEDELGTIYHPLFTKYNVDVVLQAHNHNYEHQPSRLLVILFCLEL